MSDVAAPVRDTSASPLMPISNPNSAPPNAGTAKARPVAPQSSTAPGVTGPSPGAARQATPRKRRRRKPAMPPLLKAPAAMLGRLAWATACTSSSSESRRGPALVCRASSKAASASSAASAARSSLAATPGLTEEQRTRGARAAGASSVQGTPTARQQSSRGAKLLSGYSPSKHLLARLATRAASSACARRTCRARRADSARSSGGVWASTEECARRSQASIRCRVSPASRSAIPRLASACRASTACASVSPPRRADRRTRNRSSSARPRPSGWRNSASMAVTAITASSCSAEEASTATSRTAVPLSHCWSASFTRCPSKRAWMAVDTASAASPSSKVTYALRTASCVERRSSQGNATSDARVCWRTMRCRSRCGMAARTTAETAA